MPRRYEGATRTMNHGFHQPPVPHRSKYSTLSYLHGVIAALIAAAIVVGVGAKVWYDDWYSREVGRQHLIESNNDPVIAELVSQLKEHESPIPLVLNYHNITEGATDKAYDVAASEFRAQMKLLHDAGYTALTAKQYIDFLGGKFTPPANSFLLTFDDGASGTYRYADPILEEYGFHGVIMVISQFVGTRPPYYLTWAQIRLMDESGRWSFGSHSAESHQRHMTHNGSESSAFATRDYSGKKAETLGQYRRRIRADLAQVEKDFARENVPLASMFAWPFSETLLANDSYRRSSTADDDAAKIALKVVNQTYQVAFTNVESPRPSTYLNYKSGPVERLEFRIDHTLNDFVQRIVGTKELPVDKKYELAADESWWSRNFARTDPPLDSDKKGAIILPAEVPVYQAEWRIVGTSAWSEYTVHAVLGGSHSPSASKSGVRVDVDATGDIFIGGTADLVYINVRNSSRNSRAANFTVKKPTAVDIHVGQKAVTVKLATGEKYVYKRRNKKHPLGGIGVHLEGDVKNPSARPQITELTATGISEKSR